MNHPIRRIRFFSGAESALRRVLAFAAEWGAVRVVSVPSHVADLVVEGRVIESTGRWLVLAITAQDAEGRNWIDDRHYADDSLQNIAAQINNDLLQARAQFSVQQLRDLHHSDAASFAEVDLLDSEYSAFYEQMQRPYDEYRRALRQAIDKAEGVRSGGSVRKALGAAASLVLPRSCDAESGCHQNGPVHYGATGTTVFLDDLKKRPVSDSAQVIVALLQSFRANMAGR